MEWKMIKKCQPWTTLFNQNHSMNFFISKFLSIQDLLILNTRFINIIIPFFRKLESSACPIEAMDDPYRFISVADCRLMISKLWMRRHVCGWLKAGSFQAPALLEVRTKGRLRSITAALLPSSLLLSCPSRLSPFSGKGNDRSDDVYIWRVSTP